MITILLFAELQDEAGKAQMEVEKAGLTVSELRQWLIDECKLTSLPEAMTAINESYASDDERVREGDVIAFIPPVSGG